MTNAAFTLVMLPPHDDVRRGWAARVAAEPVGVRVLQPETMEEAIRYPILSARDGDQMGPCVIAGPTCDSADVLYEKTPYNLPLTLTVGDEVLIDNTGAYTTTYSSVGFNGYPPLRQYVI